VPQMLNYESIGGVNFKKGCYPGQEVVARSQFRGTLKRRGYIVTSETALQAGQEVFDSREPEQPCGQVAQAAAHPAGGYIAIVSMQVAAQDSPALHAGSTDGAKLLLQALPYALLDDV
jgi:tRNA-modifying protein YgfZ